VPKPGRILLYAAEDALHVVRRRLDGICGAAGLSIADLDVQVITAPTDARITAALSGADQPQPFAGLRALCRIRTATLYERLAAMTADGRLIKSADGYQIAAR
jgi:hypothetical protein